MKTLVLLTLFTLAIAESTRSLEKPKDKRTPVGQSSLNGGGGGGGGGGSYSSPSGSYGVPSSQYGSPSSQYNSPSSQYVSSSPQYSAQNLGYIAAPSASYLTNGVATPGHSFGASALSYGLPNLAYLPSHMYSLPAINLPISAGAAGYSQSPAASTDLSALFQHSYLLQPAVHNLFTPQFDISSLYSAINPAYQQIAALPAAAATTKLGPVTFGAGHGGLADLGLYNAQHLAQTYQTPSHAAYTSSAAASSYSGPSSSYTSSGSSPSAYSSGSSQYSQSSPSTYTSPNTYSSPSSYSPSSSSSYSQPSYSSPSSSYSSPSSSYGSPSSSSYNTISYSKP